MNTFLSYITIFITILFIDYTYYLTIIILNYYNINKLGVGSNLIFCCNYLTTLLFLSQKSCCTGVFCIVFYSFFVKNRKKYVNFLQFFLLVYQQVTKNLKK